MRDHPSALTCPCFMLPMGGFCPNLPEIRPANSQPDHSNGWFLPELARNSTRLHATPSSHPRHSVKSAVRFSLDSVGAVRGRIAAAREAAFPEFFPGPRKCDKIRGIVWDENSLAGPVKSLVGGRIMRNFLIACIVLFTIAGTAIGEEPKQPAKDHGGPRQGRQTGDGLIPAGEFLMGSPDSDADAYHEEKPQHRVRITKPFYMGKYPGDAGAVGSGDG